MENSTSHQTSTLELDSTTGTEARAATTTALASGSPVARNAASLAYYYAHRDSVREQQRAYYATHTKEIAARHDANYAANPEPQRARRRAYYAANTEKVAAKSVVYYATNREEILAAKAAYYAANTEKIAARDAAYYAANTEKIAAAKAVYRAANTEKIAARMLKWKYDLTPAERAEILEQQGGLCACGCGTPATEVDHCHDCWDIDRRGSVRGLVCHPCNVGLDHIARFSPLHAAYLATHAVICPARLEDAV